MEELRARLAEVEARIAVACERAGRRRDEVTLLAVTKVFPVSAIEQAHELGLREFGENYVQEFEGKAGVARALAGARFHLIGHLQSNKAAKAVGRIKRAVQTGWEIPMESALAVERENQQLLFQSEDAKEGLAAYVEKRPANFKAK